MKKKLISLASGDSNYSHYNLIASVPGGRQGRTRDGEQGQLDSCETEKALTGPQSCGE